MSRSMVAGDMLKTHANGYRWTPTASASLEVRPDQDLIVVTDAVSYTLKVIMPPAQEAAGRIISIRAEAVSAGGTIRPYDVDQSTALNDPLTTTGDYCYLYSDGYSWKVFIELST